METQEELLVHVVRRVGPSSASEVRIGAMFVSMEQFAEGLLIAASIEVHEHLIGAFGHHFPSLFTTRYPGDAPTTCRTPPAGWSLPTGIGS